MVNAIAQHNNNKPVKYNRVLIEVIFTHPAGGKWYQRQPEK
jgi:hypothetical protein